MNFSRYIRCSCHLIRILLTVILLAVPLTAAQEGFRWFDDDDYKPYIYKDKAGNPQGIFKDLMTEIFRRLNIPLTCKLYAWKRTQVFVHNGLADGMVTVATKKRLETMVSTQPLVTSGEKIFARKDNPRIEQIKQIKSIDDLKPFRVVEVTGAGWAEEHFKDLPHMVWVPKLTSALYMLANGRVDIYVMNEFSGIETIKTMIQTPSPFQENFKKIIVCPHTLETISYSLLINKDSKWATLVPKINATIDAIKEDGTYDRIMQKYLTIDPKEP